MHNANPAAPQNVGLGAAPSVNNVASFELGLEGLEQAEARLLCLIKFLKSVANCRAVAHAMFLAHLGVSRG